MVTSSNFTPIGVLLSVQGQQAFVNAMAQATTTSGQAQAAIRGFAQAVNQAAVPTARLGGHFRDFNHHLGSSVFYSQQVGAGFVTLRGQAGALALVLASLAGAASEFVKDAIKVELTLAKVNSVMGLSAPLFSTVALGIREMATAIPFTIEQLSEIATEVARAGVSGSDNILKMTRAMADFAATSDVAAKESVTAFATIMLALREPPERIRALTSAVSELDRSLPAAQGKIIAFTQRIAGAGAVVGFTAEELFSIAAAVTSTGIQAEAGGTAIQRVFFAISAAVGKGGETLDAYATISGQTAAQFKTDWESRPAQAFTRFVQGIAESGDQASEVLKELELGDVRLIRTIVTTGGVLDKLAGAFETSNRAGREATATQIRAGQIYATTASQITILENKLRDNALEVGTSLLPAYRRFLSFIVDNVLPGLGALSDFLVQEIVPQMEATADAAGTLLALALRDLSEVLSGIPEPADKTTEALRNLAGQLGDKLRADILKPLGTLRDLINFLNLAGASAVVAYRGLLLLSAQAQSGGTGPWSALALASRAKAAQEFADAIAEMNKVEDRGAAGRREFNEVIKKSNEQVDKGTEIAKTRATTDKEALALTRLSTTALTENLAGRVVAVALYHQEREALTQLANLDDRGAERLAQLDAEITRQGALVKVTKEELAERAQQQRGMPDPLGNADRFKDFASDSEKAKTGLQKLGVSADQARKFLESMGISTEDTDVALLALGASANELGESIEGAGISTAQAIRLMQAAGLSAEEIAVKLNEIRLERWNKELDEAAKKSKAALKAITDRIEELTGGILDELVPAMELAASLVGEDFTGAMRGAAVATTAALTDALIQQAALVGGPYAGALIAVAGVLAEAARSTSDWKDTTEDLSLSAEAAVDALTHQAEAALELAKVNGDTEIAVAGMAAAVGQLRTLFQRLPDDQRKVALRLLDGVDALITHAKAAGDDEAALGILLQGLEALTGGLGDYVDAVDKAIEADRKRAEEARTAEEELALARGKEERSTAALVTANERLLKARQALATARGGGDTDAIRAAGLEVSLARDAVSRAKDRAREARGERGEAEIAVAEAVAPTAAEGAIAGEIIAESVAEAEARVKRERVRSRIAAIGTPEFIEGTVPLSVGALPGADQVPLRTGAGATPAGSSSRTVTVNATYVTQPEVTVRHDLEALSMVGLV